MRTDAGDPMSDTRATTDVGNSPDSISVRALSIQVAGPAMDRTRLVTRGGYTLQLCADPAQFAAVRCIVGAHLHLWGRERLIDVAALCVTEMLANVHRHVSAPECELALLNLPEGIRAAVSDGSSVLPVVAEPDWCAESGRGMFLLAHAAACWGAVPTATGKTVWVLLRDAA